MKQRCRFALNKLRIGTQHFQQRLESDTASLAQNDAFPQKIVKSDLT
jgi:hypothetical protein